MASGLRPLLERSGGPFLALACTPADTLLARVGMARGGPRARPRGFLLFMVRLAYLYAGLHPRGHIAGPRWNGPRCPPRPWTDEVAHTKKSCKRDARSMQLLLTTAAPLGSPPRPRVGYRRSRRLSAVMNSASASLVAIAFGVPSACLWAAGQGGTHIVSVPFTFLRMTRPSLTTSCSHRNLNST